MTDETPPIWRRLGELTWPEARDALRPETVILLPTGAIEAHGPHLPLDTDVVIAAATAERAATRLAGSGERVVVLPSLVYGVSYVGTCFPGTTPVPAEHLVGQIVSVVGEVARWGPRRFALVNAHLEPAHIAALREGALLAERASGARVAFADQREERWSATLSEEFQRGARHGGSYETSIVLAAAPDRVRLDKLASLTPVWVDLPGRLRSGARTFAEAGGIEGYFGDPAVATAEEGDRLLDALARMVETAVVELGPIGGASVDAS
jgi:creatinine amidohydrolase